MKITTGAALLASAGLTRAAAIADRAASQALCGQKAYQEGGNWYCQAVSHITYTNVGTSGEYDDVVHMDQNTGNCIKAKRPFSGPLAPFNEQLSVHLRGPIHLKQMAVYMPGTSSRRESSTLPGLGKVHPKREDADPPHTTQERREHPAVWVTAVIDGQTVSWINDWWGEPTASTESPAPVTSTPVTADPSPTQPPSSVPESSGSAKGLTFLANYGGMGSGKWTPAFGNTLSYVDPTGSTGAAGPQILANTTIQSGKEVIIMTDQKCDAGCGYVQPGSVAYKGFDGSDKTFLFEFQMPHDDEAGVAAGAFLADQPALWMLNARIPRTSQYGACSCFQTGCGEFDVFEVLAPGGAKCKSTLHSDARSSGGDSNFFHRPAAGEPVTVAVVYGSASRSVSVKVVDWAAGAPFPAGLSAAQIGDLAADAGGLASSRFAIGS